MSEWAKKIAKMTEIKLIPNIAQEDAGSVKFPKLAGFSSMEEELGVSKLQPQNCIDIIAEVVNCYQKTGKDKKFMIQDFNQKQWDYTTGWMNLHKLVVSTNAAFNHPDIKNEMEIAKKNEIWDNMYTHWRQNITRGMIQDIYIHEAPISYLFEAHILINEEIPDFEDDDIFSMSGYDSMCSDEDYSIENNQDPEEELVDNKEHSMILEDDSQVNHESNDDGEDQLTTEEEYSNESTHHHTRTKPIREITLNVSMNNFKNRQIYNHVGIQLEPHKLGLVLNKGIQVDLPKDEENLLEQTPISSESKRISNSGHRKYAPLKEPSKIMQEKRTMDHVKPRLQGASSTGREIRLPKTAVRRNRSLREETTSNSKSNISCKSGKKSSKRKFFVYEEGVTITNPYIDYLPKYKKAYHEGEKIKPMNTSLYISNPKVATSHGSTEILKKSKFERFRISGLPKPVEGKMFSGISPQIINIERRIEESDEVIRQEKMRETRRKYLTTRDKDKEEIQNMYLDLFLNGSFRDMHSISYGEFFKNEMIRRKMEKNNSITNNSETVFRGMNQK